jgi:HEAT repeat protein
VSASGEPNLRRFQETGEMASLLAHVRQSGEDAPMFEQAIARLAPVLDPIAFGEHPRLDAVSEADLQPVAAQVIAILGWMLDSPKANLRDAATDLMGALGWETFLPTLTARFATGATADRVAALRALSRMPQAQAHYIVHEAGTDPDPEVRAESARWRQEGRAR